MKRSLTRRIFLAMLSIGLINAIATLVATEIIYEDIEEANLTVALAQERDYFANRIDGQQSQSWTSALLQVFYLPETQQADPRAQQQLPAILRNRPVPFAAEVEEGERTYLILVNAIQQPAGVMYLAQDISIIEDREDILQEVGFVILSLSLMIICLLLALAGARHVTRPLKQLTRQLQAISPEKRLQPITPRYRDRELEEVRQVLNELLHALDTYVRREKSLVGMASHELRTPVAVIAGALDVMEQRNTLNPDDRRTLARIRQAADKMQSDISALLTLARQPARAGTGTLQPAELLATVVSELKHSNPHFRERIRYHRNGQEFPLAVDTDLLHMLVRNLLQNALRHTRGCVDLTLDGDTIEVRDSGEGLPDTARCILSGDRDAETREQGLGLYIVRLLAERLACQLELATEQGDGTCIRVHCPRQSC